MIRKSCPIRALSPAGDGWQYWVGYYDLQPWSADGAKLLCHRARFADRFPGVGETCEVGYLDLTREVAAGGGHPFVRVAETRAWNWQQGAMLRWWDESGEETLLFNDREAGRDAELVARVVGLDGVERRRVAGPVLAVAADGRWGLSLSMGRVNSVRFEYGYAGEADAFAAEPAPSGDGVFRVDMHTGERRLIVPLSSLRVTPAERGNADEPFGYVNHLMFNRSGGRFCFVHRYERTDGIVQTRLFTSDMDGEDVRLLMSGMVSHYDWRDDETILAWAGFRKLLGDGGSAGGGGGAGLGARAMVAARRTLKPIYYALGKPRFLMSRIVKDSYMLIPDVAGAAERGLVREWAAGELTCDGHCTFNRGGAAPGRFVVTDGYPDRGKQPLFVCDVQAGAGYEVGRYESPARFDREVRVDLHPRFSRDGRRVCIDSAQENVRRVYEVDVSSITACVADGGGEEGGGEGGATESGAVETSQGDEPAARRAAS